MRRTAAAELIARRRGRPRRAERLFRGFRAALLPVLTEYGVLNHHARRRHIGGTFTDLMVSEGGGCASTSC